MLCNYCGSNIPDDARFCDMCGKQVRHRPSAIENSQGPEKRPDILLASGTPGANKATGGIEIFCVICGTGNPHYALFCRKCGKHLVLETLEKSKLEPVGLGAPLSTAENNDAEVKGKVKSRNAFEEFIQKSTALADINEGSSGAVDQRAEKRVGIGAQPVVSHPLLYATMSQRFVAYLADFVLIYWIVIIVYAFSGVFGSPLPDNYEIWIRLLVLFTYMIVAQASYHTTIGKYIMGIEVASENPNFGYPSFWRIFVRETIGRFVASLFWGIGYWRAIRNWKKQAWSDELANTVVRVRQTNRLLRRAFTGFVLVALVFDIGMIAWAQYQKDRSDRYQALMKEIAPVSSQVSSAWASIEEILNRKVNSFEEAKANMQEMLGVLARYDPAIDRTARLLQRAESENLIASAMERENLKKLRQVYDLRKKQSEKLRQEANLVLEYNQYTDNWSTLTTQLRLLDSDISSLDKQAAQLLQEIGIK